MYSKILTDLSMARFLPQAARLCTNRPFSTPSSLFMYQPPVFCTNHPFSSPTARFSPHLHIRQPVYAPTAFFLPQAVRLCTNRPFFAPTTLFFHQPPVFHPTCTQLPRLSFPRGPRRVTRLEPGVS